MIYTYKTMFQLKFYKIGPKFALESFYFEKVNIFSYDKNDVTYPDFKDYELLDS